MPLIECSESTSSRSHGLEHGLLNIAVAVITSIKPLTALVQFTGVVLEMKGKIEGLEWVPLRIPVKVSDFPRFGDEATVTVKLTIGGFLSSLVGLSHRLDDISSLLGKYSDTGLEKKPIGRYAHRVGQKDGEAIYESNFEIPGDFGEIGAVLVQNELRNEMYLKYIVLNGLPSGPIAFNCGSWVESKFDNPEKRIFFSNKQWHPKSLDNDVMLTIANPRGLKGMREKELASLRGNGEGERKTSDRIYDYDVYNDLGNPDSKSELGRPVLGGSKNFHILGDVELDVHDPHSETRSGTFYVPRDEEFSEVKEASFITKTADSVLHALIPSLETSLLDSNLGFPLFSDIDQLYKEGITIPKLKNQGLLRRVLPRLVKAVSEAKDDIVKFDSPAMFQMDWPPDVYGPPESAITTELVEREIKGFMTVDEPSSSLAHQWMESHSGSKFSRPVWKATGCWLGRFAKAHFLAHDSGYHELVSHWLRTHCATEPYIIATNRQLSAMHPIYKLLHPHFRYTMQINALARQALINADGIIETSFSPSKYSMELSSVAYDQLWRFDKEALPGDLINRGIAVEDPTAPHGLKLLIEDYPFANDGLILWDALKQWVADNVNYYYKDASMVQSDPELQGMCGWPPLTTQPSILDNMLLLVTSPIGLPLLEPICPLKTQQEKDGNDFWTIPNLNSWEHMEPAWGEEPVIKEAFERFSAKLKELGVIIDSRNADDSLKNRGGAGVVPYELLKPFSEAGVTGKGVPYSISI
ncbi:Linoleate 13S-lipoxygenase 2-1, chloroplastic [Vitis vinifera]|uniref:Lipoxygenase n=1 Tax=Vitis vinifera TaxID=29760 RepID=A0A438JV15_VITVI|nr:Linoleate 13S-lipoxygenase 2-1, chloroplastic [Vitis vinifera]